MGPTQPEKAGNIQIKIQLLIGLGFFSSLLWFKRPGITVCELLQSASALEKVSLSSSQPNPIFHNFYFLDALYMKLKPAGWTCCLVTKFRATVIKLFQNI